MRPSSNQFRRKIAQVRRAPERPQPSPESLGTQAEHALDRYFFRRLDHLAHVRRFIFGWIVLVVLLAGCLVWQVRALDGYFQSFQPIAGGVYTEGINGDFTNANPLYASGPVDESVSRLIFAGLFTYDDNNQLVGDLAQGYTTDPSGKIYTVRLKPNLTWQDGVPLTARDVLFTYRTIQNPDAQSMLNRSWQGITVAAPDDLTVTFTLPNVLGSFPYDMTNGIVPEHLLGGIPAAELRSAGFNTEHPVGAGPFAWHTIVVSGDSPTTRQAQIGLLPFKNYQAGSPKLASFVIHAFHDAGQLESSFSSQQLTAASLSDLPPSFKRQKSIQVHNFILSAADMVFFKHSNPVLGDAAVRKALVQAVNVPAIIDGLGYSTRPVYGPFLLGQLGYDKTQVQPSFNPAAAVALLASDGWNVGADGVRVKAGKPLSFALDARDATESRYVSEQLARAWQSVGAQVTVRYQAAEDLKRVADDHSYDALLYGISIGVDPDVFVYWHSSQNDIRSSRLNFSEFASKTADISLEAGRTRIDPQLRAVKYRPFLQAWQQDTPALGLYQPRYLYVTRGKVFGLQQHILNSETDRYANVQNWEIRQAAVTD